MCDYKYTIQEANYWYWVSKWRTGRALTKEECLEIANEYMAVAMGVL